jgi:predicted ATPase
MFMNIRLKNFMSFKDIDVSFGSTTPLNYALFYGENGAGKTNLIQSISFLRESATTLKAEAIIQKGKFPEECEPFPMPNLSKICEEVRTYGSKGNMLAHYEMIINGSRAEYEMEFADNALVHEILKVKLKRKIGVLFEISNDGGKIAKYLWDGFITDPAFQTEMCSKIDRLWGKHSFLAILNREYLENNQKYLDDRVHKAKEVIRYIEAIRINVKPIISDLRVCRYSFSGDLEQGVATDEDLKALDAYGKALKKFFRRIYHNVIDVYYSKTPVENGNRYDLMFRRKLDGDTVDVPSVRESFGTRKLVQMFQTLVGCASGQVAFIDEIDSGIHDKLIQDLLPQVLQDIDGQLIITTHNTGLLKKVAPKNVFVIDIDAEGFKKISKFSSEIKTMANNNNQNRYMNNAVGGVPYVGTVDLKSIAEGLQSDLVM